MDIGSLYDIIQQYDWREAASVGIGAVAGIVHGAIDERLHRKNTPDIYMYCVRLGAGTASGLAPYLPHLPDHISKRDDANFVLGYMATVAAYALTRKVVERVGKRSVKL
jgi:hypothetical protein